MLRANALFAMAAGICLLQVGCIGAADESVEAFDDMGAMALNVEDDETDPDSGTTQNGLETSIFHAKKWAVLDAISEPAFTAATQQPNAYLTTLGQTTTGRKMVRYLAKCALPEGMQIGSYNPPAVGLHLLDIATLWPNWGLDTSGVNDVFACLAAHLNPSGTLVSLKLTGSPVYGQGAGTGIDTHTFKEALWASKIDTTGAIQIHVWPLNDLYQACSTMTNDQLATRVCGSTSPSSLANCALVRHNSPSGNCEESSPGVYATCMVDGSSVPVIQSWLDPEYVPVMYPRCTGR